MDEENPVAVVGTKVGERPQPLRGLDPSLVPGPITQIPVT